ncbi:hypothetical protein ACI2UN_06185 [Ralstonia nicotianae]|uniref:Transposase n=1 Tax=Ralstonia nicotianae TaxID=3037696 RepID=A0ABX7ZXG8_9RALS|nr:hypothetical protein [Ralstonia nicotianae]QUP59815.1 hypothetical protein GO999_15315 [Ralstonia nicotianae]
MNTLINLETGFPANPWLAWGGARRDNVEPIQYLEYLRFDLLNIFWRPSSNFRIRSCFASRAA